GSIGQASFPSRVFKGMRMPGHMGSKRVTMQGLTVIKVDTVNNILIVKGTVPGPNGGLLILKHTTKGRI
ncbi:MAG: 50S ribosomal protein L3, partial [Thermodesulfobacteriota bacterium]